MTSNEADIWFEESEQAIHSELGDILGNARQVSPSYRPAQLRGLLALRHKLNTLIEVWARADAS